jgi:hypothetical protein
MSPYDRAFARPDLRGMARALGFELGRAHDSVFRNFSAVATSMSRCRRANCKRIVNVEASSYRQ